MITWVARTHDPPRSRPFLIINQGMRALNINHMRSKHTHKIGFQSKVYSKQHKSKGQNMPKYGKKKAKMVLKNQSENQNSKIKFAARQSENSKVKTKAKL